MHARDVFVAWERPRGTGLRSASGSLLRHCEFEAVRGRATKFSAGKSSYGILGSSHGIQLRCYLGHTVAFRIGDDAQEPAPVLFSSSFPYFVPLAIFLGSP